DVVFNLRESLKPQKNYVFYCQSCGNAIVKDRKFRRVLPLPSENWSVLVEEWCCHPNPFARSTLHPQHDDCFLGDTFFLLNSGDESNVSEPPKSKGSSRVICKRCRTTLGETLSSDTVKYYLTELTIQPAEEHFTPTPRSQFLQSMVAHCLGELSSSRSTFRFTVKGDDGKIYALIWLLNSDTVLVESSASSFSHGASTLFGDVLMPSSGVVETWNAVKVLYQPCTKSRNKDLAETWENDIGVHSLTLPSETCLELLLTLAASTASLPPSLRCLNSFQV
ncbi:UBE3D ligase, partial [Upupa epops]|nr:UBE3D ligase [Upupa epops]